MTSAVVVGLAESLELLRSAAADLSAVGRIETLSFEAGEAVAVSDIVLAKQPAA